MIVQCPDCSSRFRLPDDKLKAGGTKVRCSRCQKVFTVMPGYDSQPAADSVSDNWNETDGSGGAGFHEFDFGDSPSDGETSGQFDAKDNFSTGSDFDFDAFGGDQEQESDDFFADSGEGSDDFAFGEPAGFEDGSEFSMGEDDEEDFFPPLPGDLLKSRLPQILPMLSGFLRQCLPMPKLWIGKRPYLKS